MSTGFAATNKTFTDIAPDHELTFFKGSLRLHQGVQGVLGRGFTERVHPHETDWILTRHKL